MMDVADKSTWPTKQDVAKDLHVTERTLEIKIKRGEIRADTRAVPGRKPLVIIDPRDFETLKSKAVRPEPIPKRDIAKKVNAEVVSASNPKAKNETTASLRNLRKGVLAGAFQLPFHRIRWLSLADASAFSGLPRDFLKAAIEDGSLPALSRDGRYFIKWIDLENFHPQGEMSKPKLRNGAVVNMITSESNLTD